MLLLMILLSESTKILTNEQQIVAKRILGDFTRVLPNIFGRGSDFSKTAKS